jgi:hypothetical protein
MLRSEHSLVETNDVAALNHLRPHGPLHWIFSKIPSAGPWSIIGALSSEDRFMAAAEQTISVRPGADAHFLYIQPEELSTNSFLDATKKKLKVRRKDATTNLPTAKIVEAGNLLSKDHAIINLAYELVERCHPNVVLDISTMPKRFFFPLLSVLIQSPHVSNLIATNTAPERYCEELANNAAEWVPLPMFNGDPLEEPTDATLIIGVGYQPLNVKDILERIRTLRVAIRLMLPFPSLHPGFIPNWNFFNHIKSEWGTGINENQAPPIEIVRVATHDVSLAFDRLVQHSEEGRKEALIMAPYGPKAISLAMCLLGIAREKRLGISTEIGYTQPSFYHPDYSSGVATRDGFPDVTAYCLRLNGRDLYQIS